MRTVKAFFARVAALFASPKAQQAFAKAADLTAAALPYIETTAKLVAGLTPTTLDDQALAFIQSRYPQLFDHSIQNGDQLKLFAFAAAADLLRQKYPGISTSIARLAVQAAYTGNREQA